MRRRFLASPFPRNLTDARLLLQSRDRSRRTRRTSFDVLDAVRFSLPSLISNLLILSLERTGLPRATTQSSRASRTSRVIPRCPLPARRIALTRPHTAEQTRLPSLPSDSGLLPSSRPSPTPTAPFPSTTTPTRPLSTLARTPSPSSLPFSSCSSVSSGTSFPSSSLQTLLTALSTRSAVTPFYSQYQLKALNSNPKGFESVLFGDTSPEAKALRSVWKQGTMWITLDVMDAVAKSGLPRENLTRVLSRWE